jgi:hypothetical protein
VSARPELRVIEDPLTGFDGDLTIENLRLLAGRVQELDEQRRASLAKLTASEDKVEGLKGTVASQAGLIAELRRDRDAEARGHDLWPVAERLFAIWKAATGNTSTRSTLTTDRFEILLPHLKGAEGAELSHDRLDGPPRNRLEECAAAIVGRVFEHFSDQRSNGTTRHYWEWERIFGNGRTGRRGKESVGALEESMARRPRDWRDRLRDLDPGPQ